MTSQAQADIGVIGGGPAGLAAALWAARYRRSVVVVDSGEQRNRWTDATHGYLGLDGISPTELLERGRADVLRYPNVTITGGRAAGVRRTDSCLSIDLDGGASLDVARLVLATGMRDVFPDIAGFERFYGSSVFTCPSCDGFESRDRGVAIIGTEDMGSLAVGLLDWASSVTIVVEHARAGEVDPAHPRVRVAVGDPVELVGDQNLTAIRLRCGTEVPCDVVFSAIAHEPQSPFAAQLGCAMVDGCVHVDTDGMTSVEHVYAVGDITPGPHLVQVAAAKGAIAGIAAARSLSTG